MQQPAQDLQWTQKLAGVQADADVCRTHQLCRMFSCRQERLRTLRAALGTSRAVPLPDAEPRAAEPPQPGQQGELGMPIVHVA